MSLARTGWRNAASATVLVLVCGVARAQAPAPLAPLTLTGDAGRGQVLAYTCKGCHGVPGYRNAYPSFNVPKLGGQNADYIEVALQGYRRGTRHHLTMEAQAATMSDQDVADIAAYFAGLNAEPEAGISDAGTSTIQAGQEKSATCAACHGAAGVAASPQWPNLAGQHASYLRHALGQYKSGARADLVMGPMLAALDDEALGEIAAYFAALPGLYVTE